MYAKKVIMFFLFFLAGFSCFASQDDYKKGVEYFRNGQFQKALTFFKKAAKTSPENSQVSYNIGVINYKLGIYGDAAESFTVISESDPMFFLAQYNLGLISLKKNNPDLALEYFSVVIELSGNTKLATLAKYQIDKISTDKNNQAAEAEKNNFLMEAFVGVGYDNHLLLFEQRSSGGYGDSYNNLGINALFPLWRNSVNFYSSLDIMNYSEYSEYNRMDLELELSYRLKFGNSEVELSLGAENNWSDDSQYLFTTKLQAEFLHHISNCYAAKLRFLYSDFSAEKHNFFLGGSSNEIYLETGCYTDNTDIFLYYDYSDYNREDIKRQFVSFSFSPEVHKIGVGGSFMVFSGIEVDFDIGYSRSEYSTPDRLVWFGRLFERYRDDSHTYASVSVSADIVKSLKFRTAASYTNKESNISAEDYERTDMAVFLVYSN